MMKQAPTTSPPRRQPDGDCIDVPPVASTSSGSQRGRLADQIGMQLERRSRRTEHVARTNRLRCSLPGRRAGTKPQPISLAIAGPRMKREPRRPMISPAFGLFAHFTETNDRGVQRLGVGEQGVMSLKPDAGVGKFGHFTNLRAEISYAPAHVADLAPKQERCELLASSVNVWRSWMPAPRRRRCENECGRNKVARARRASSRLRCGRCASGARRQPVLVSWAHTMATVGVALR